MRVSFFMPGMHPGSLVWDLYQDLCEAIRRRDVEVTFLTRADAPDQQESPHVVLLRSSRAYRWLGRLAARVFQLRTSYLVPSAIGLASYLRRHGDTVDVLHVENVYPDGAAAVAAAALARWSGPILVKPMGEDVLVVEEAQYGFRRFMIPRMLVTWVLQRAAGIRCTSPLIAEVVKTIGTTTPIRLIAVHTSVRTAAMAEASAETVDQFRRRARTQLEQRVSIGQDSVILSLGRLHPYKGVDTLIAAFAQTPDAVLIVAGPSLTVQPWGDYGRHLERVAERHGVRSRVVFLGRQTPEQALDLLAAADVVVVPSRLEAHNKVCIEAAAVRTPFVVTNTTGIAASVPTTGVGIVVPVDDTDAMAGAMTRILAGHWHLDAAAAGCFAEQFSPDRIANKIVGMYADLIR